MNKELYNGNRLYILLPLFCSLYLTAYTQTRTIDSLRNISLTANTKEEKLQAFILLGQERNSLHADSLSIYAAATRQLANTLHNKEALLDAGLMDISVLTKKGQQEAGLQLAEKELPVIYTLPALRHKHRKFYLSKGFILNVLNKPKEAQEVLLHALHEAEKENDILVQSAAINGIGWSYQNLNDHSTAIQWYKKAILLLRNNPLNNRLSEEMMAVLHSNIGPAYYMLSQKESNKGYADTARLYLDSAITVCRQKDFIGLLAISLGYAALLLSDNEKNSVRAEALLTEGISIRKKLGQLYFIILDMVKLGELYLKTGQYEKGISICREAVFLADSSNTKSDIIYLYDILARNYKAAGNYKAYGDILNRKSLVQDSINQANTAATLNEMQVKYEVQKKEALIAKQQYDLFLRKLLLYGICTFTILLAALIFIRFNKYKSNQKQKMFSLIEAEKKQQQEAAKEAGEKERKRIAAELHDNLGVQANAILHNSNLLGANTDTQKVIVTNLRDTAREMLLNLRETLWAMKTNDIPAPELWLRIINFMKQMGRHYTATRFETKGWATENYILPAGKALNMVLVIQEAVNNAIKHSQAETILVESQLEADCWIIFIKDNGKGFNYNERFTSTDSHGLANMQERALQSNFKIEFNGNPGSGTVIKLIVYS